jgi:hypothetical protein
MKAQKQKGHLMSGGLDEFVDYTGFFGFLVIGDEPGGSGAPQMGSNATGSVEATGSGPA